MTKKEFRDRIKKSKLILDGATGSNLQKRGMPVGVCPEEWIIENSEVLKQLQIEYIQAGSDVLYAPTFSGNRIKLEEYGLDDKLSEINTKLVEISKAAVDEGLTDEEKKAMCKAVTAAGADYIKTSTGFSKAGATRENVSLMASHVTDGTLVKAAGGIASLEDAADFIALGASRLGTSRVVAAVKEGSRK